MALAFLISFTVTKIAKDITKKLIAKKLRAKKSWKKKIKVTSPQGGGLQLIDDNELTFIIISCIADNEDYLVKSQKMSRW